MRERIENDGKKKWKNVRVWLGWGGSVGSPKKLVDIISKKLEESPSKLPNIINQFYINKVKI